MQARGSILELETQIVIFERLEFIDVATLDELKKATTEIGKMLNGLLRYLTPDA